MQWTRRARELPLSQENADRECQLFLGRERIGVSTFSKREGQEVVNFPLEKRHREVSASPLRRETGYVNCHREREGTG